MLKMETTGHKCLSENNVKNAAAIEVAAFFYVLVSIISHQIHKDRKIGNILI